MKKVLGLVVLASLVLAASSKAAPEKDTAGDYLTNKQIVTWYNHHKEDIPALPPKLAEPDKIALLRGYRYLWGVEVMEILDGNEAHQLPFAKVHWPLLALYQTAHSGADQVQLGQNIEKDLSERYQTYSISIVPGTSGPPEIFIYK